MRTRQTLNGIWEYRIGQGAWGEKQVPYASLPVGESTCARTFDMPAHPGSRAFLVFEGITYEAAVMLNGHVLGSMLAYAEYRWEVTGLLAPEGNQLEVAISVIAPAFGPSEGWENYGGIIRDVYIEYTNDTVIQNYLWETALNADLSAACGTLTVEVDGPI